MRHPGRSSRTRASVCARHHTHRASAGRRLDRLGLQLCLYLAHPVLHLLYLAQHLHRIFHSDTSFTLVTRPSNLRTTSRTNGSSSGLAFGVDFTASPSRSRKSTLTLSPSQAFT